MKVSFNVSCVDLFNASCRERSSLVGSTMQVTCKKRTGSRECWNIRYVSSCNIITSHEWLVWSCTLFLNFGAILTVEYFGLFLQNILQEGIASRREAEFNRLKKEREDRISQLIAMRKQEREKKRKLLYFIKSENERLTKLREEEERRKHEGDIYCAVLWCETCHFNICWVH